MSPRELRIERRGDVESVTLDRPDARNALTHRTYAELEQAVRETTARFQDLRRRSARTDPRSPPRPAG